MHDQPIDPHELPPIPESRYAAPAGPSPIELALRMRLKAAEATAARQNYYDGALEETFRDVLEIVSAKIHANNIAKGWWDDRMALIDPPGEPVCAVPDRGQIPGLLMLVVSELSEALEAHRKHNPQDKHLPDLPNFDVELADAVIRILDIARAYGIDLGRAIVEKMAFNATRPHRHGGKAC